MNPGASATSSSIIPFGPNGVDIVSVTIPKLSIGYDVFPTYSMSPG